jgi:hypothetical protein
MAAKQPVKLTTGLKAAPPAAMGFLQKKSLVIPPAVGHEPVVNIASKDQAVDVITHAPVPAPNQGWWTKPVYTTTTNSVEVMFTGEDRYTYLHERIMAICCEQYIVAPYAVTLDTVVIEMQDSLGSEQRLINFMNTAWGAKANIYDDGDITHYLAQMYNGLDVLAHDTVQMPAFLYPTPDMLKVIMSAPIKPRRIVVVLDDAFVNNPIVRKFRLASQVIRVPRFGTYVMTSSFKLITKLLQLQNVQRYEYMCEMANGDPRWMLNALYFSAMDNHNTDDNLMSLGQNNWLQTAKQYLLHGNHEMVSWYCRAPAKDVYAHFVKVTQAAKGGFIVRALTSLALSVRTSLCMTPLPAPPVVDNVSLEKYLHVTNLPAVNMLSQAFVSEPANALELLADMLDIYSLSDVSGAVAREHLQKSALYITRQKHRWPAYGSFLRPKDLDGIYFDYLRKYGSRRVERQPVTFWNVACQLPNKTVQETAILYMAAAQQDKPCRVVYMAIPEDGLCTPENVWQYALQCIDRSTDVAKRRVVEEPATTPWKLALNYFVRALGSKPPSWSVILDKLQNMMIKATRIQVSNEWISPLIKTDVEFVCHACRCIGTFELAPKEDSGGVAKKETWTCVYCADRANKVQMVQTRVVKIT